MSVSRQDAEWPVGRESTGANFVAAIVAAGCIIVLLTPIFAWLLT